MMRLILRKRPLFLKAILDEKLPLFHIPKKFCLHLLNNLDTSPKTEFNLLQKMQHNLSNPFSNERLLDFVEMELMDVSESYRKWEYGRFVTENLSEYFFIIVLKEKNIFPKFNASKTTGRVTGISFKYNDVIYKGSTLGRQYSWNNLIKKIDYEQVRDRAVILENDMPKRGFKAIGTENNGATIGDFGATGSSEKGTREINQKPEYNLEKTQSDDLMKDYNDEIDWTPFKLELEDKDCFKRKKRKGRRL